MRAIRDLLDKAFGRVTMYRLILLVLVVLAVVYLLFTATGVIEGLSTGDNLLALAVLVVASYAANRILGLIWRITPHADSAHITALLLFFLFIPITTDAANLAWLALAAVLANASKYVLAWRGRHVLNPAAAGAFLVVLLQYVVGRESSINPIWQTAASESLLPFVAVGALIVLWRTRRLDIGLVFAVLSAALVVWGLVGFGQSFGDSLSTAFTSYPIVFLAGFMLSEPLTLPPRRYQQLIVAVVTAVVFAYPIAIYRITDTPPDLGLLNPTPEIALLVGNLVAFAFSRRSGVRLQLRDKQRIGGDVWELSFEPKRSLRFTPGQYLELHLPHGKADVRGVRRVFSISSAPHHDDVRIGIRVPEKSSSFKRSLLDLPEGARVHATGVSGDFVLPSEGPVLLVAGGIGITPFLSQLRANPDRDAVLVYGVPDGADAPYAAELAELGVRVVLVSPGEAPSNLADGWTHIGGDVITGDVIDAAVPDADRRRAFISGPPAMVNAVRGALARRVRSVHTDYFSGY